MASLYDGKCPLPYPYAQVIPVMTERNRMDTDTASGTPWSHPVTLGALLGLVSHTGTVGKTGTEVLVVGAGPSGLFAAVELARHGVQARVVERAPEPHRQARATALQPATLEILQQAGIADRVLESSEHLRFSRVFDADLRCVAEMPFAGAGCRWEFQCSLPQWQTEQILAGRLAELGGTVERGLEVVSVTERDEDVLVTLRQPGGATETVAAPWVVGAGGAASVTRGSMAESLLGTTYPGTALVADVRVSCGLPRDGGALIASPAGYVLLAPLPAGRWITFIGELDEAEAQRLDQDRSIAAVTAAIERRVPGGLRLDDVAWASPFRMHRRLAPHLADRRRFLLGDAGHLSSPFGGEGLNSGLQDAHNLAWKLALAQRGRARPSLLESFEAERAAADRHVLEISDGLHELAEGAVESARTGVFPAPLSKERLAEMVRSRSMLDVSYAGTPLIGEYLAPGTAPPAGPAPGGRYPDRIDLPGTQHHLLIFGEAEDAAVAEFAARWNDLVDIACPAGDGRQAERPGSLAVLLRPDGHVGFRAAPASQAGLRALDAHLDSYLVPA
jgi:6-methylpretetramide 4-monooxygenase / 4-hydroxy-6-methylpretetramide 12a-monooxygenase